MKYFGFVFGFLIVLSTLEIAIALPTNDNILMGWKYEQGGSFFSDVRERTNWSRNVSVESFSTGGKYGGYANFSGSAYLNDTVQKIILPNESITISAWVYRSFASGAHYDTVLEYDKVNDANLFGFGVFNNHLWTLRSPPGGANTECEGTTTFPNLQWVHIAVVMNATHVKTYLQGNLERTCSITTTEGALSTAYLTGGMNGAPFANTWAGGIDSLYIFNTSLSASEILSINNSEQDFSFVDSTTYLSITARDILTSQSILVFNASVNGTHYSTTNGTINTAVNQTQNFIFNITVSGVCGGGFCNYSTSSIQNFNTSSNLQANLSFWHFKSNQSTSPVFELDTQTASLQINHSTSSFSHSINDVSATFSWNGTQQTVTKTSYQNYTIFNVSFITPSINSANVTLLWTYNISRGNGLSNLTFTSTETKIQQVFSIGIDNCSTYSIRAINFTIRNETNDAILNATIAGYFETYISSISQFRSFNLSWVQSTSPSICINQHTANYTFSAQLQYGATGFNTETYYFNQANLNNITDILNLYLTSNPSLVQFTVVDENDDPVPNVYIQVLLYDLTTDSTTVTEILKTSDPSGTAIGNIILNTERYKFILTYNGDIVLETSDVILTSTSYQFRISVGQDYFINYDTAFHTNCYVSFNNATKQTSFSFSDSTNQVNMGCLEINFFSGGSNYQLNRSCVAGSAGSLSLIPMNQTRIGTYIGSGSVEIDGHSYPCGNLTSYTTNTRANILGVRGLIYGMFIFITMVTIGIANPAVALFMGLLGLFISWLLGLFYLSAPVFIGLIAVFLVGAWRSGK